MLVAALINALAALLKGVLDLLPDIDLPAWMVLGPYGTWLGGVLSPFGNFVPIPLLLTVMAAVFTAALVAFGARTGVFIYNKVRGSG